MEKAVKAGRIIRAPSKTGMMMYFVPRWEFSRENLFRQKLNGQVKKQAGDIKDLTKAQDDQFGFHWDPSQLISSGLEQLGGSGSISAIMDMPSALPPTMSLGASSGV